MKPAHLLPRCLLVAAAALALSGCAAWWPWSAPPARVAEKKEAVAASNRAVIADGQAELAGAQTAASALPDGETKKVTLDFLNRGADLIAQGNGPLDAARALKMRDIALGLLSTERAEKEKAQSALAQERGRADETVAENSRLKDELTDLHGKLAVSWAERDEKAKKWERMWFWIYAAAGLYAASIALPILSGAFPGVGAIGLLAKVVGFAASPAIQYAKDRAVGGLVRIGHALEDFRQDAPAMAAKITRTFDSYTDADHRRVVGAAAKDYRDNIRPFELRGKSAQDATAAAV